MKVFIALILAVTLAVVYSEDCHHDNDCTSSGVTTCGSGYMVKCHNHQCDCLRASGGSCVAQADCPKCDGHDGHCVDGTCHCRQQGGGGNGR